MNEIRITLTRSRSGMYSGTRQCGSFRGKNLPKVDIGPEAKVTLDDGRKIEVRELLTALGTSTASTAKRTVVWNERCQATVGRWLGEQLFGVTRLSTEEVEWFRGAAVRSHGIAVVIVSSDHHVAFLPWPLLLLSNYLAGIHPKTVSLCARASMLDHPVDLPGSARILIAVPELPGNGATGADAHLRKLTEALEKRDRGVRNPGRWKVVRTWEEFKTGLQSWRPHVVYFYGHGQMADSDFSLVFQEAHINPLTLKAVLEGLGDRGPRLIYFNCCFGGEGGQLSLGSCLGELVPVLLTNRTTAYRQASCDQAIQFWKNVLIEGLDPQVAASELYLLRAGGGPISETERWFNPLIYRGYKEWRSQPMPEVAPSGAGPRWKLRLDRFIQYRTVGGEVRDMVSNSPKVKGRIFLWTGSSGAGLHEFCDRLLLEFPRELKEATMIPVQVEWDDMLSNNLAAINWRPVFGNMLKRAFDDVSSVEHIPSHIGSPESGKLILVNIVHRPITESRLGMKLLGAYLKFLDDFVGMLNSKQYCMIGIPYEIPLLAASIGPETEMEFGARQQKVDLALGGAANGYESRNTSSFVLPHFSSVTENDLCKFLQSLDRFSSVEDRNEFAQGAFLATGGDYSKLIKYLEENLHL